jgi:HEAT repeat protein
LWEALLSVGDLSVVQEIENDLDQNPPVTDSFVLPRDRLLLLRDRVFRAFCALRDPVVIPFLEHLMESSNARIRVEALMALRQIGDIHSAPVFLRALDDSQNDMNFIAMQSLFELAGGGVIEWLPSFEELTKHPDLYAAKCREWWRTEGEPKARVRIAATLK